MAKEKGKLVYLKLFLDDWKGFKRIMSNEQLGDMMCLTMDYLDTGVEPEGLSSHDPMVQLAAIQMFNRVDTSRESYEKISAERAAAGSKGGNAKAGNTAKTGKASTAGKDTHKEATVKNFKAPARSVFTDYICKELYVIEKDEYTLHYKDERGDKVEEVDKDEKKRLESERKYAIDRVFDHLDENGWHIGSAAITCRDDWEQVALAYFNYDTAPTDTLLEIYRDTDGFRDSDGKCCLSILADIYPGTTYNEVQDIVFHGEKYCGSDVSANVRYLRDYLRSKETEKADYLADLLDGMLHSKC